MTREFLTVYSKLADWDDDDYPQHTGGRWEKVIILRYMFTLKELAEDPVALIELKQDVREECEKLGEVTNVVLFDGEEDGIMTVRFTDERAAAECIKVCPPQKKWMLIKDHEWTIFQWPTN